MRGSSMVSISLVRRPRFRPLEPWQRNQYAVVMAVALAFGSFELTQSFVPLYIRELGAGNLADAAFWSGLVAGVAPLCAAIMGPFWGNLADRYGRKPMVLRALVFISIMQFTCAFVPNVEWLLAARVLMGLFAGFTSMAMALAIAVSPRERMAQAIGLVQAAQIAPAAVGPLIGGVLSDLIGLRNTFMVTGVLLIIPSLMLTFLVNESFDRKAAESAGGKGKSARGSMLSLVLIPGFVVSSGAVAATCSSIFYGRLARPENTRRLLLTALAGGAFCSVLIAFAGNWLHVIVLRVVLGLFAGGTMSLAYTMGARLAPSERSGLTLSVLASCGMLGGAISPIMAGFLGQLSLRIVFFATAAAYMIAVGLAALPSVRRAGMVEPAPAGEAVE